MVDKRNVYGARGCLQGKLESVEEDLLQRNREISRLQAEVDRQRVSANDATSQARRLESSLEDSQQANAALTTEKADALREVQRAELELKLQLQQANDKHARTLENLHEEKKAEIQQLRSEHEAAVATLNSTADDITAHAQVCTYTLTVVAQPCELRWLTATWYLYHRIGKACYSIVGVWGDDVHVCRG